MHHERAIADHLSGQNAHNALLQLQAGGKDMYKHMQRRRPPRCNADRRHITGMIPVRTATLSSRILP